MDNTTLMDKSVSKPAHPKERTATAGQDAPTLLYIFKSMRPRQWPKNALLFLPLLFTLRQYWQPFTPTMWQFLALTLGAFFVFCLISGLVYIINDLVDVEKDRYHPRKRLRPIASGKLGQREAIFGAVGIFVLGAFGALMLDQLGRTVPYAAGEAQVPTPIPFTLVAVVYLVLQIGYSFYLKHIVIVDVFAIAAGFLLRVVAGAAIIQVPISPWLYLVMILGALFIGFSKRRNELVVLEGNAASHRAILKEYTTELLDEMISVTTACTVIAYSLYTFTAENLPRNHAMMATIPIVLYGIFRYLYLIHVRNEGGSPEELLLRDYPLLASVILYGLTVAVILFVFGHS